MRPHREHADRRESRDDHASRAARPDQRAGLVGSKRREYAQGYALPQQRDQCFGMEDRRSEMRHFRRLPVTETVHRLGARHAARIGAHQSRRVGPYLQLFRAHRRRYHAGRVVGTVAADGRYAAPSGPSDEAGHHGQTPPTLEIRAERALDARQRSGPRVVFVGQKADLSRLYGFGVDAGDAQRSGEQRRAETLAERQHAIERRRRDLAHHLYAAQQRFEPEQQRLQKSFRKTEVACQAEMKSSHGRGASLALQRAAARRQERVGGPPDRRDHHHRPPLQGLLDRVDAGPYS